MLLVLGGDGVLSLLLHGLHKVLHVLERFDLQRHGGDSEATGLKYNFSRVKGNVEKQKINGFVFFQSFSATDAPPKSLYTLNMSKKMKRLEILVTSGIAKLRNK